MRVLAARVSLNFTRFNGLGNLLSQVQRDTLTVGGGVEITRVAGSLSYDGRARLVSRRVGGVGTIGYGYDAAGNLTFEAEPGPSQGNQRERAAYYGVDGRLRAVDLRTTGGRRLEEYRYDALGRRVWVRQRTQCEPTTDRVCVTGFARRTLWDGARELAEIQAPSIRWGPRCRSWTAAGGCCRTASLRGPIRIRSMAGWCIPRGWRSISG